MPRILPTSEDSNVNEYIYLLPRLTGSRNFASYSQFAIAL